MNRIIALIVASSGAGKTSICQRLSDKYGLRQVWSYTTRPPRNEFEIGHRFISENDMPDKSEMCAYTYYNGNHYFATHQQVDEADLYVIDPAGIQYFLKHYRGTKLPKVIKIQVPIMERMKRMAARGDTEYDIMRRIECDKQMFRHIPYDAKFENDDLETCVDEIYNYLCEQEGKLMENERDIS
jgi:guanylate kinase